MGGVDEALEAASHKTASRLVQQCSSICMIEELSLKNLVQMQIIVKTKQDTATHHCNVLP